jgi:hypothetical protein
MRYRRESAAKIAPLVLVSPTEACKLVQEYFHSETAIYSTKTIYNKVYERELQRYGPRHKLLLDKQEILEKLCKHHGK